MPSINITWPTSDSIEEVLEMEITREGALTFSGDTIGDPSILLIRDKKDKEVYGGKWDKSNGRPPDDRFYHVSYDENGRCTEFYFKNERYFTRIDKGWLNCNIKNFYKEDEDRNIELITCEESPPYWNEFYDILNNYEKIYYYYVLTEEDILGKKD